MEYDLIIKGGSVIDGSGTDAVTADIAISGGRIKRIGDLTGVTAKDIIMKKMHPVMPHGLFFA